MKLAGGVGGVGGGGGVGRAGAGGGVGAPPQSPPGGAIPDFSWKNVAMALHQPSASFNCPASILATVACRASSMPGRPSSAAHAPPKPAT